MMTNQLNVVPTATALEKLVDVESITESLDNSLTTLFGKRIFFRSDFSRESIPLQMKEESQKTIPYQIRTFARTSRDRQIIGIDSSCALIGETEDGPIFAGRVAVVGSFRANTRAHCRAGPFIFYMSHETLEEELRRSLPAKVIKAILSDIGLAERFIRIRLERSAQLQVARIHSDAIILVDGSLRSSVLEMPTLSLKELERSAEENFNQLVGFSKTSSIRFVANLAGMLQSTGRCNCYCDITDPLRIFAQRLDGRVLLAKFAQNSRVFRVDMSRVNAEEDPQVLADLKANDIFFRGYPETLRLAHHLSVFDSFTVSSTRSYISKKFGLIRVPSDDLRATILGKLV
jgi:hypothetical protein